MSRIRGTEFQLAKFFGSFPRFDQIPRWSHSEGLEEQKQFSIFPLMRRRADFDQVRRRYNQIVVRLLNMLKYQIDRVRFQTYSHHPLIIERTTKGANIKVDSLSPLSFAHAQLIFLPKGLAATPPFYKSSEAVKKSSLHGATGFSRGHFHRLARRSLILEPRSASFSSDGHRQLGRSDNFTTSQSNFIISLRF